MHQIVLFIAPRENDFDRDSEIGNLFMNRFAIEEDANFEILKIIYVEEYFWDNDLDDKAKDEKGKGLIKCPFAVY